MSARAPDTSVEAALRDAYRVDDGGEAGQKLAERAAMSDEEATSLREGERLWAEHADDIRKRLDKAWTTADQPKEQP